MSEALVKLYNRYCKAKKFNFDISIKGIRLTKDVIEFIKDKNLQGLKFANNRYYVTDKLVLPKKEKSKIKEGKLEVNYKIGNSISSEFSYSPMLNTISFSKLDLKDIPENRIDEFISDSLTHEFLHALLYKEFNIDISIMFELIEHYFRNDNLHKEFINNYNKYHSLQKATYQQYIDKNFNGNFNIFLEEMHISEIDKIQAYIIANNRLKNENH